MNRGQRLFDDGKRPTVEGAIAEDGAVAVLDIEYRRKTQVYAMRAQFNREHIAHLTRQLPALRGVLVPKHAKLAHRRQDSKSRSQPLNASALLVDGNEQGRLAQAVDL